MGAVQRARQDTQPLFCWARPGLPECILPKQGTCPAWEGSLGAPSLGRCRDVLPEEAEDLGWVRSFFRCLPCLGLSGCGGPAWRAAASPARVWGEARGAHAAYTGSL